MPIYEYKCQDCGTKFEKLVRNSSVETGLECPSCGQQHLRPKQADGPVCPSGRCSNPGMCGMNMN